MSKCSTCEFVGEPEAMTEIGNTGEFIWESLDFNGVACE